MAGETALTVNVGNIFVVADGVIERLPDIGSFGTNSSICAGAMPRSRVATRDGLSASAAVQTHADGDAIPAEARSGIVLAGQGEGYVLGNEADLAVLFGGSPLAAANPAQLTAHSSSTSGGLGPHGRARAHRPRRARSRGV